MHRLLRTHAQLFRGHFQHSQGVQRLGAFNGCVVNVDFGDFYCVSVGHLFLVRKGVFEDSKALFIHVEGAEGV